MTTDCTDLERLVEYTGTTRSYIEYLYLKTMCNEIHTDLIGPFCNSKNAWPEHNLPPIQLLLFLYSATCSLLSTDLDRNNLMSFSDQG